MDIFGQRQETLSPLQGFDTMSTNDVGLMDFSCESPTADIFVDGLWARDCNECHFEDNQTIPAQDETIPAPGFYSDQNNEQGGVYPSVRADTTHFTPSNNNAERNTISMFDTAQRWVPSIGAPSCMVDAPPSMVDEPLMTMDQIVAPPPPPFSPVDDFMPSSDFMPVTDLYMCPTAPALDAPEFNMATTPPPSCKEEKRRRGRPNKGDLRGPRKPKWDGPPRAPGRPKGSLGAPKTTGDKRGRPQSDYRDDDAKMKDRRVANNSFAPILATNNSSAPILSINNSSAPINNSFAPINDSFAPINDSFAPINNSFAPINNSSAPGVISFQSTASLKQRESRTIGSCSNNTRSASLPSNEDAKVLAERTHVMEMLHNYVQAVVDDYGPIGPITIFDTVIKKATAGCGSTCHDGGFVGKGQICCGNVCITRTACKKTPLDESDDFIGLFKHMIKPTLGVFVSPGRFINCGSTLFHYKGKRTPPQEYYNLSAIQRNYAVSCPDGWWIVAQLQKNGPKRWNPSKENPGARIAESEDEYYNCQIQEAGDKRLIVVAVKSIDPGEELLLQMRPYDVRAEGIGRECVFRA